MFVLGFGMNHVGPEVVTTVSNHSFLGSVSEVAFLSQGGPWSLSLSLFFAWVFEAGRNFVRDSRRRHGPMPGETITM